MWCKFGGNETLVFHRVYCLPGNAPKRTSLAPISCYLGAIGAIDFWNYHSDWIGMLNDSTHRMDPETGGKSHVLAKR